MIAVESAWSEEYHSHNSKLTLGLLTLRDHCVVLLGQLWASKSYYKPPRSSCSFRCSGLLWLKTQHACLTPASIHHHLCFLFTSVWSPVHNVWTVTHTAVQSPLLPSLPSHYQLSHTACLPQLTNHFIPPGTHLGTCHKHLGSYCNFCHIQFSMQPSMN